MKRLALALLVAGAFLLLVSQMDYVYPDTLLPSKTVYPTPTWEQITKPSPPSVMFFPAVFEQQRIVKPK